MIDNQLIKWRIGPRVDDGYQLLAYIDARTAMKQLDDMDPAWSTVAPQPVYEGGKVVAYVHGITVKGVTRYDIGQVSNMEPHKGGVSDGLKRAAQTFGIGRELYDQPRVIIPSKDSPLRPTFNNTTGRWEIEKPGIVLYPDDPEPAKERETARKLAREMGLSKAEVEEINGGPLDNNTDFGALINKLLEKRTGGTVVSS